MSGLFGWLFKIAQSSDLQGPTPEQLREAEENGLEWDDKIGFYPASQKPSAANEISVEDEQNDVNKAEEPKKQLALTNEEDVPEVSTSSDDDCEIARWERLRDVCRGTRPNNGEFDEDELFSGPGIRPGMYD